uniref:Cytochrome P450 n=1 Tax=Mycena chlorophos TaxID=658473 RepID=A0ABQ0LHW7_MYCCL|nr:predicted protein [Mycena chlorophos]
MTFFVSAILLGVLTHVFFHRYEPASASGPFFALLLEPLLLVLFLDFNNASLSITIAVAAAFWASLVTSIVAYRLSPWHPLAHVPGPVLARISKWWSVRNVFKGNQQRVFKALHDQYGECVRVGPNEVSLIHVDAIKNVLGAGGLEKGQVYEPRVDPKHGIRSLLTTRRPDAHAVRRRVWNRALSSETLKEFEALLLKRVQQLIDRLDGMVKDGQGAAAVDLAAWFSYFAFDFMGDMAFGGGFEMIRDGGDKEGYWTLMKSGAKRIAILCQLPWLAPMLYKIPFLTRAPAKLRAFSSKCAANRMQSGPKLTKDLWYHLMDEEGREKVKPPMPEVVADGVLAVVAGSDTTSVALSTLIWCLLTNPEIYARVQAEVDTVFPDVDGALDTSKHDELKLLSACINETLRLFPPVPTGGARQVPAGEPRLVAGTWYIPAHTQIYVPAYVIQRCETYFSHPDVFDPDRWLRTHELHTHTPAVLIPFSYGPANCVGKALAWREMLLVASVVIRKYEMRFAMGDAEKWVDTLEDAFVTNVRGRLMVELRLPSGTSVQKTRTWMFPDSNQRTPEASY